jgi:vacuolar-type H+-ATPase subunit E/Vma4
VHPNGSIVSIIPYSKKLLSIRNKISRSLVTFYVDNAAINVNDDGSELALLEQLLEELEIDLSQHLSGLVTEVPLNRDTVSGSLIEMANSWIRADSAIVSTSTVYQFRSSSDRAWS